MKKLWARSMWFGIFALILGVVSTQAYAGITGSDPRPPKTGNGLVIGLANDSTLVAGITGSDPRPPKTGNGLVAGITGSDPRPPKTGNGLVAGKLRR